MTPVTVAFRRWLAAESDVHDANNLLLWAIHSSERLFEVQQLTVVQQLRRDASALLREYLDLVEACAASQRPLPAWPSALKLHEDRADGQP